MMNKKRSSKFGLIRFLMVLPLALALVVGNIACSSDTKKQEDKADNTTAVAAQTKTPAIEESNEMSSLQADGKVLEVVEEMPQFPEGESAMMKFVADNLKYPETAQEAGIQGRVILRFVVGKDGSISDVEVKRGIDPACDQEAVRVIKSMPKWKPGKQNGEPVAVYYNIPITFRLKR